MLLLVKGELGEAEEWLLQAADGCTAVHGEGHPESIYPRGLLGWVWMLQGKVQGKGAVEAALQQLRGEGVGIVEGHPYITRLEGALQCEVHATQEEVEEEGEAEEKELLRSSSQMNHPITAATSRKVRSAPEGGTYMIDGGVCVHM